MVEAPLSQKWRTTLSHPADHTLSVLRYSSLVAEFERFLYEGNERVDYELFLEILFYALHVPKWGISQNM